MSNATIYFDVTGMASHLLVSNTFSGIQRTVVSVLDALLQDEQACQIHLACHNFETGKYVTQPLSSFTTGDLLDPIALSRILGDMSGSTKSLLFPPLKRYARKPLKRAFHATRCAIAARLGREKTFRRLNSSIEEWRAHNERMIARQTTRHTDFTDLARAGDRLVLLDSAWSVPQAITHFSKARDMGVEVQVMIHDLIPLVRPDLCPSNAGPVFHQWLSATLQFTTLYLANSQATRVDLQAFLDHRGSSLPIVVTPLAQTPLRQVVNRQETSASLALIEADGYPLVKALAGMRDEVILLSGMRYVLCVGTIEPRKNNLRACQAWLELARTLPPGELPVLVLAGKPGWMSEPLMLMLQATGFVNGHVMCLRSPSDAELDFLYRNCLFTLMPSLYEGWGLPVGESLSYGKTAVISSTTSLPEVGGDLVSYCDPDNVMSIVDACRDLLRNPERIEELECRIKATDLRDWKAVATDIFAAGRQDTFSEY